jgi:biotin transport system substrate-specific component
MTNRDYAHIALFCAITAALGLLPAFPIPFSPVPITAQTLGVMLTGAVLGARLGVMAMLLFMAMVAIGLPLLAGGRGGLAVFVGPTVGFFLAFPLAAGVIGWLTDRSWHRLTFARALGINVLGGILAVYLLGIPFIAFIAKISLYQAAIGVLAFIPGDVLKAAAAAAITMAVKRGYPRAGERRSKDMQKGRA